VPKEIHPGTKGIAKRSVDTMTTPRTVFFLLITVIMHCIFSNRKDELIKGLQLWWEEFIDWASITFTDEELKDNRVSKVFHDRISNPNVAFDKNLLKELASQITRGSLLMETQADTADVNRTFNEDIVRFSYPICLNPIQTRRSQLRESLLPTRQIKSAFPPIMRVESPLP